MGLIESKQLYRREAGGSVGDVMTEGGRRTDVREEA